MENKVLKLIGVNYKKVNGVENVKENLAEVKQQTIMEGVYNLINLCQPGTDIEVKVEVRDFSPVSLHFKLDKAS